MIKDELLLAFSTSSSETVLPRIMLKTEKMGAPKDIVSFVIPTGYSFNLDGSTFTKQLQQSSLHKCTVLIYQLWNKLR